MKPMTPVNLVNLFPGPRHTSYPALLRSDENGPTSWRLARGKVHEVHKAIRAPLDLSGHRRAPRGRHWPRKVARSGKEPRTLSPGLCAGQVADLLPPFQIARPSCDQSCALATPRSLRTAAQ